MQAKLRAIAICLLTYHAVTWLVSRSLGLHESRATLEKYLAWKVAGGRRYSLHRNITWGIAFQRSVCRLDVDALSLLVDLFPDGIQVVQEQGFRSRHRIWQGGAWFDSAHCTAAALAGIVAQTSHQDRLIELMQKYCEWKFGGVRLLEDFRDQDLVDLFPDLPFLADFHRAGRLETLGQYESAVELLLRAAEGMPADARFRPEVMKRALRLQGRGG